MFHFTWLIVLVALYCSKSQPDRALLSEGCCTAFPFRKPLNTSQILDESTENKLVIILFIYSSLSGTCLTLPMQVSYLPLVVVGLNANKKWTHACEQ